jgi:hypothetical protein
MRFAVYAQWGKARHFTEAVVAGFPGRVRDIEPGKLAKDCIHVLGGLQFGVLELMREIRAKGEPYVFFDRAYFQGGTYTQQIRLTRDAYQKHWVEEGVESGRVRRWGVRLEPWRQTGDFVMVVPPSAEVEHLFGIEGWLEKTLLRFRGCVRRIVVSPKNDRDKSPLIERLEGCHAVVTWTSNVAVEAIVAGIPAFVSPYSAARPMAGSLEELDIENPPRPDREAWVASLAWGQFTVDEIASGFARERIMEKVNA